MTYKEYKNNSFNLYTIKTDRFKTCFLDIIFYNKVNKDAVTKENVFASMIKKFEWPNYEEYDNFYYIKT